MQNPNIINFSVNSNKLLSNLKAFNNLGNIYYPLKPNGDVEILNELIRMSKENDINLGFLVTNISHLDRLLKIGVETSNIGTINVLLDDSDIKYFYDQGVRYFTFHNLNQIANFSKYADLKSAKINVRLSIVEPFGSFSHLGASTEECKQMLTLLKSLGCIDYGISFYLQKEIIKTPNSLEFMLDYIVDNFQGFEMSFINIGGAKKPEEIDKIKLDQTRETLGVKNHILEPARYLVGNAIDMETRIIETKQINNKPCIIIKNGIYAGLVDVLLYQKQFEYKLKTNDGLITLESSANNTANYEFSMCGGSSDSGDRLGTYYIDEKYKELLKPGTTLIIPNAGCYVSEFFMPLGGDLTKQYKFYESEE